MNFKPLIFSTFIVLLSFTQCINTNAQKEGEIAQKERFERDIYAEKTINRDNAVDSSTESEILDGVYDSKANESKREKLQEQTEYNTREVYQPNKIKFLKFHLNYNKDTKTYQSVNDFIIQNDGVLLSIKQTKVFSSGSSESSFKTKKISFDGTTIFSNNHPARINSLYFVNLEGFYLEVYTTAVHQQDQTTIRVTLRDSSSGKVTQDSTFIEMPYSGKEPPHIAYDDKQKSIVISVGNIVSSYSKTMKIRNWTYKAKSNFACPPALTNDSKIFTCLANGDVLLIDRNGKISWKNKLIAPSEKAFLSISKDNKLILVDSVSINQITSDGKKEWQKYGSFLTPPIIDSKGYIWSGDFGNLISYSPSGQRVVKFFIGSNKFLNPPVLLDNGLVLSFSTDGFFTYSIKEGKEKDFIYNEYDTYGHTKKNKIVIANDNIYCLASKDNNEGLLITPNTMNFVIASGWSTINGNQKNNRQLQ